MLTRTQIGQAIDFLRDQLQNGDAVIKAVLRDELLTPRSADGADLLRLRNVVLNTSASVLERTTAARTLFRLVTST